MSPLIRPVPPGGTGFQLGGVGILREPIRGGLMVPTARTTG